MDDGEPASLQAYIDRMKDGQDTIYYMTGESREAVENSPHLEAFKEKGYEILILTDPVDEIWTQSVFQYQEKNCNPSAAARWTWARKTKKKKRKKRSKKPKRTLR
jgi:molecular chaperone HtpG